MSATHDNTIIVNVFLATLSPARQGFDALLHIAIDTGNSLNGDTVRTYTSSADADADFAAGFITSQVQAFIKAAFTQQPRLSTVKVTTAAAAAYDLAYTAARGADDGFYGVCIDSRLAADIIEVSDAVEADAEKVFAFQSADADVITAGFPAALSSIVSNERTLPVYHPTDAEPGDIAWLASRLVFDPDVQSAPWDGQIRGVAAYTLTGAQRDAAIANNFNVILPFGPAPLYVSRGVNIAGRPVYEIVSGDWYRARVREDLAQRKVEASARGEKILVAPSGQSIVRGVLEGRALQGESAGHFAASTEDTPATRITMPTITSDDLSNRRIRGTVEAQIGTDAVLFDINVYESTNPLSVA